MRENRLRGFAGRLLLAVLAALALPVLADPGGGDGVLALVGDRPVPAEALAAFSRGRAAAGTGQRPPDLDDYLDALTLEARAKDLGIDRTPAFRHALALLEWKLLAGAWMAAERGRRPAVAAPAEADLRAWYDANPGAYLRPAGFTARQLLVLVKGNPAFPGRGLEPAAALARAEDARTRLAAGDSWAEVARAHSDDAGTRDHGGLLQDGRFGYQPAEVEAALRAQPLGQLGAPVRSALGYHVIQVQARVLEGTRRPLDEVREELAGRLRAARQAALDAGIMGPARTLRALRPRAAAGKPFPRTRAEAVGETEVLADLDGQPVTEADFQWFLRDAYRPAQRRELLRRSAARPGLVAAYLDLRVQAAMALACGLDREPAYGATRPVAELDLLGAFLLEREGQAPWQASPASLRAYLDRLRTDHRVRSVSR